MLRPRLALAAPSERPQLELVAVLGAGSRKAEDHRQAAAAPHELPSGAVLEPVGERGRATGGVNEHRVAEREAQRVATARLRD